MFWSENHKTGRMPNGSFKQFRCEQDYIVAYYREMEEWLKQA